MILCGKFPVAQWDPWASDPTAPKFKKPVGDIELSEGFFEHEHQPCPVADSRASHWYEHSYEHNDDAQQRTWLPGEVFELARFPVPPGVQARISVLETAALGLQAGALVPNAAWLYPSYYRRSVTGGWPASIDRSVGLAFYLRLESWRRLSIPGEPRTLDSIDDLPGIAHPSLGEWHDTRYDFSRETRTSILVPDGHYLTLWVEIANRVSDRLINLWGRLAGMRQTYRDNPQAIDESRRWRQL